MKNVSLACGVARVTRHAQISQNDVSMASEAGPITFVATRHCFQPKKALSSNFHLFVKFLGNGLINVQAIISQKIQNRFFLFNLMIPYNGKVLNFQMS